MSFTKMLNFDPSMDKKLHPPLKSGMKLFIHF